MPPTSASLAICLLTSGRAGYTETTLRSFSHHNRDRGYTLLHADDGSRDERNMVLAAEHGFTTVFRSPSRSGGIAALRAMWRHAAELGCSRILHAENDWAWVGPVPDIDWPCVRLYGADKGLGERCSTIDLRTRLPVTWTPDREGWESATIHWGGPPSITSTPLLIEAVAKATKMGEIGRSFSVPTLRPVENIVWHIGAITTNESEE